MGPCDFEVPRPATRDPPDTWPYWWQPCATPPSPPASPPQPPDPPPSPWPPAPTTADAGNACATLTFADKPAGDIYEVVGPPAKCVAAALHMPTTKTACQRAASAMARGFTDDTARSLRDEGDNAYNGPFCSTHPWKKNHVLWNDNGRTDSGWGGDWRAVCTTEPVYATGTGAVARENINAAGTGFTFSVWVQRANEAGPDRAWEPIIDFGNGRDQDNIIVSFDSEGKHPMGYHRLNAISCPAGFTYCAVSANPGRENEHPAATAGSAFCDFDSDCQGDRWCASAEHRLASNDTCVQPAEGRWDHLLIAEGEARFPRNKWVHVAVVHTHVLEAHDKSKCRRSGYFDDGCCARADHMSCADDYVLTTGKLCFQGRALKLFRASYHFTCTPPEGQATIYWDGVKMATDSFPLPHPVERSGLYVGRSHSPGIPRFEGTM